MNLLRTKTTYVNAENATIALRRTLEKFGRTLDNSRYLIAVSADGRYAPVLVGNEYIPFAVNANITVVS